MKRAIFVLALLPLGLAGCGGSSDEPSSAAAPPTQVAATQAPAVDTEAIKARAQSLLDKWGCKPPDDPLSTNGAPGAYPGAPYVGTTCATGKTGSDGFPESTGLLTFSSPAAKDAWVPYATSQIGGTLCLGDDWVLQDPQPTSRFVTLTGCRVR